MGSLLGSQFLKETKKKKEQKILESIKDKAAVHSTGVLHHKSVHFQPVNPTFLLTDPAVTSLALVKPVESEIYPKLPLTLASK